MADRIRSLRIDVDSPILKQGEGIPAPTAGPPQMDGGMGSPMGMGGPPMAGEAPMPGGMPPPKSALGEHIDQLDSMVQDLLLGQLAGQIDATNQLLSQQRATGIASMMTLAMQNDINEASAMVHEMAMALTAKISMVRDNFASLNQHGPPAADPMMAAMGAQAPMNIPPEAAAAPPGPGM